MQNNSLLLLTLLSFGACFVSFLTRLILNRKEDKPLQTTFNFGVFFFKSLGNFLFYILAVFVLENISQDDYVLWICYVPLILSILYEYNIVGDNITKFTGRKIYMFILIDKIFKALEFKFLKKK